MGQGGPTLRRPSNQLQVLTIEHWLASYWSFDHDFIKSYAYYSLGLLARASSRKERAGLPATDPFGEIDFVTTAPAEIFVPEPTMSGFPTLPLTMVDPAPTKTSSSITT